MTDLLTGIKNVLFPRECVGCNRYGSWLCPACRKKIPIRDSRQLPRIRYQDYIDRIYIVSFYKHQPLARLLDLYKYHYQEELSKPLSSLAQSYLKKNQLYKKFLDWLLIPLPLHRRRLLERGFNQSEMLATTIAEDGELTCSVKALQRSKYTKHQTELDHKQRLRNLKDAFVVSDRSLTLGKKILLVDDVVTTGASLNEAAKVLRKNGAIQIAGLVIAKN